MPAQLSYSHYQDILPHFPLIGQKHVCTCLTASRFELQLRPFAEDRLMGRWMNGWILGGFEDDNFCKIIPTFSNTAKWDQDQQKSTCNLQIQIGFSHSFRYLNAQVSALLSLIFVEFFIN